MFARVHSLLVKEFIQLWRDKWGRFRLIVPPLLQLLLFGYAATFEVYHVSTAVLDLDHTQESRELVARFTSSNRFNIVAQAQSQDEVDAMIERSDAVVALTVHAGFAQLLRKGQEAPLQVVVDGTNSNTALIALGYVNTIAAQFSQDYGADLAERLQGINGMEQVHVNVEPRPWYNPDLNGRWFFVPGVIATIQLIMLVNLTAFAVVREREVGTLEQIMVTPIRPAEFIIGKTVPFFVVGLGLAALVTVVGIGWFQIPFVGNPMLFVAGETLYLFSLLALGLLISTVCATQQQAFATNFFVLNPLFILSGFSFPISSMPKLLQWFTYVDPLRYFLVIIRSTFLKGVGISVLWPQFAALATISTVLLLASILRFRKSLE
ncbi:ABC transporter permease [Bradyrhizobium sp.]|uniref:ABC transporter permease n=1 Tax=Bradyrhizobium sp. TaxID=376 RepID=UPI003C523D35